MQENEKIKVMVNGLPGNMATNVAKHVLGDSRFELTPFSLTGPGIEISELAVGSQQKQIRLIKPEKRKAITSVQSSEGAFITIDFTQPEAVNINAQFYCDHGLPFVMGTTGGDRKRLNEVVEASAIVAVVAPNMAKQIVGFQAMMEYAAATFPGLFTGYSLTIVESHQHSKPDTSGTAKAMVEQPNGLPGVFNRLGIPFSESQILKVRNPDIQRSILGVPEQYLAGHGWHTYKLVSPDGTVVFEFTHNVNGRDVYAKGTLDAVAFLDKKVREGVKGKVFSMIDVLKG